MKKLILFLILCAAFTQPIQAQQNVVAVGATLPQTGTIDDAADVVTLTIPPGRGYASIGVSASGTWVGTIAVQCAARTATDTFVALTLAPRDSATTVTSFTANGQWSGSISGCQRVRAVPTAWTSGSAEVTLVGSFASSSVGSLGSTFAVTQSTSPWIVAGGGTAGSAATGVVTIQGIASGTAVTVAPSSGSFATDQTVGATVGTTGPLIICDASSTAPTAVTTGQNQAIHCNLNGQLIIGPRGPLVSGAVTSAMTGTTTTSVVSGTASNFLYIQSCLVSNASLTVSTDILLQDGSGGTTLFVIPAPAAAVATTGGGGATHYFGDYGLKVPTSGNALYAANVTTGSSTKISCNGYRSTISY